jgi:hypothetical protein
VSKTKGASKLRTKQRLPRFFERGLSLGGPGLAIASERRINICELVLVLRSSLRAENPGEEEEGNLGEVIKEKCKYYLIPKKICKSTDAYVVSQVLTMPCHEFLEPPTLHSEGSKPGACSKLGSQK